MKLLREYGSVGVCDALSAAFIAGFIAPSSPEGVGVSAANVAKIIYLQDLLKLILDDCESNDEKTGRSAKFPFFVIR